MWDTTAVPGLLGINEGVVVYAPPKSAAAARLSGPIPYILLTYLIPHEGESHTPRSGRVVVTSVRPQPMEVPEPM